MKTQKVALVPLATAPLEEIPPKAALEQLIRRRVQSCSDYRGTVVPCQFHAFVEAVHIAFAQHRPLALSPDMFWLLIVQGLSNCVEANPEKMRSHFVAHSGRVRIEVRRDDFVKGSPENPWDEVIATFSGAVRNHIGAQNHDRLVVSFSTTGKIERAANEVALLECMKSYFEYAVVTLCGIPRVILEGEPEDWRRLVQKAEEVGRHYGLEDWTGRMLPHLEAVARNAAGAEDPGLWGNFYKWNSASGGDYISGWITDFFPYLRGDRSKPGAATLPNPYFIAPSPGRLTADQIPAGISRAPFEWQVLQDSYSMEFAAGFIAVSQDRTTLAVRPKIGWAVTEARERGQGYLGIALTGGTETTVAGVTPSSPAEQMGFRKGDRIVRISGTEVSDRFQLGRHLAYRLEGDEVELGVLRDGQELPLRGTLGAPPHRDDDERLMDPPRKDAGLSYRSRGRLRVRSGNLEGALGDFARAFELHSGYSMGDAFDIGLDRPTPHDLGSGPITSATTLKALALVARGGWRRVWRDVEGSVADCTSALELVPEDPLVGVPATLTRGVSLLWLGKPEAAIRDLSWALERFPDLGEAYVHRGYACYDLGRWADALQDLERGTALRSWIHGEKGLTRHCRLWACRSWGGDLNGAHRELEALRNYERDGFRPNEGDRISDFLLGRLDEAGLFRTDAMAGLDLAYLSRAYFYAGTLDLLRGNDKKALGSLRKCAQAGQWNTPEYVSALAILGRK